jgi:hypothetical protein
MKFVWRRVSTRRRRRRDGAVSPSGSFDSPLTFSDPLPGGFRSYLVDAAVN